MFSEKPINRMGTSALLLAMLAAGFFLPPSDKADPKVVEVAHYVLCILFGWVANNFFDYWAKGAREEKV